MNERLMSAEVKAALDVAELAVDEWTRLEIQLERTREELSGTRQALDGYLRLVTHLRERLSRSQEHNRELAQRAREWERLVQTSAAAWSEELRDVQQERDRLLVWVAYKNMLVSPSTVKQFMQFCNLADGDKWEWEVYEALVAEWTKRGRMLIERDVSG